MATELKIPVPDQTTEEVRIVGWKKTVGETVSEGEVILEVETDKSVMEVEAVTAGTLLEVLCQEDDMVPVGQVVAYIGAAGTKVEKKEQAAAAPAKAEPSSKGPCAACEKSDVKATPLARKVAEELHVDLAGVQGTGCKGKVTREDVQRSQSGGGVQSGGRLLASPNAKRLALNLGVYLNQIAGTGPGGRILGDDVQAFAKTRKAAPAASMAAGTAVGLEGAAISWGPEAGGPQPGTTESLTKIRRAIGLNLQNSSRDVPHFNTTMSIDMSRAMQVRSLLNQGKEKSQRVSVNDLVVRGCALALKKYPAVNSRFSETEIEYLKPINVGVATAIDIGLVVPVLTNADSRSWSDLAAETKRLAQEARGGKIIGAGKGTFTVSNLGMFGVETFTAIINPPESAILAVGAVKNEVVDIGGGIGVRPIMRVTLCSDHRIIDGALAARFLQAVKLYLEQMITTQG